ncbi:MAG: isoprenylcysteine carboxylmethyltransferase family protein [Rhodocyclaceae bacterium]|nr:isoprenylcysteine carboxylmethyltransferase family protein [Rhodocyclaceae bacterium]
MNDSAPDSRATRAAAKHGRHARSLETRIPPPIVAALICAAMWWLSPASPMLQLPASVRVVVALAIASFGGVVAMGASIRFRRAKTTVNPLKPQNASSLVTAGIYRYTRNPMYLGLLFLVVAWAMLLSSPFALLGPVAFVSYIGRFQIVPEERVLSALFGAEYSAYQSQVRRWL